MNAVQLFTAMLLSAIACAFVGGLLNVLILTQVAVTLVVGAGIVAIGALALPDKMEKRKQ